MEDKSSERVSNCRVFFHSSVSYIQIVFYKFLTIHDVSFKLVPYMAGVVGIEPTLLVLKTLLLPLHHTPKMGGFPPVTESVYSDSPQLSEETNYSINQLYHNQ